VLSKSRREATRSEKPGGFFAEVFAKTVEISTFAQEGLTK